LRAVLAEAPGLLRQFETTVGVANPMVASTNAAMTGLEKAPAFGYRLNSLLSKSFF
jgi:hypothetical protein